MNMSAATRTFQNARAALFAVHKNSSTRDKVAFYDTWAKSYDQDMVILEFLSPIAAAKSIDSHFTGDREAALVLDVACGTGMVAKQLKKCGFEHFVGIDGSNGMLELAKKTGLYQDFKKCMLGEEPLPVQWGSFDVVVIAGALSVGHVPVRVVRELYKATKPGGFICMTSRFDDENAEYKAELERELKRMEEEGLWVCVDVTEVEEWERAVSEQEEGYISGSAYFYKKLPL